MPLQITESWGFPCPGPGEDLALKVALAAELQSCLWLEHKMSSVQRGQTKARSTRICGKSRGRARAGQQDACGRGRRNGSTKMLGTGLAGHAAMKTVSPQAWVSPKEPAQDRASQDP